MFLKLEIIKKVIIVLTILVSIRFGIYGLLWGQSISSALAFFINSHYTGKILKYNGFHQLMDILPTIILSFVVGGFLYVLDEYFFVHLMDIFRILLIVSIYIALYLGFAFVFKCKEIDYIKELIKK